MQLATSTLTSRLDLPVRGGKSHQEQKDPSSFLLKEIPERERRKSQTIRDYLKRDGHLPQSKTIILTDTEEDRQVLTYHLRQELIQEHKLGSDSIRSVVLQPKNIEPKDLTQIQNYQVGNAIKFNRQSNRFSNQRFYKILSIDEHGKVLKLGDRFITFSWILDAKE